MQKIQELMKNILKTVLSIIVLSLLWSVFIFFTSLNGWWYQGLTESKESNDFFKEAKKEISNAQVGSVVMALIEKGTVQNEHLFSLDNTVNRNTAFQVASLSKWITAWGVMSLVEEGKLNLDTSVEEYLTKWKLPKSNFNNKEVTVRLLLSHTAGLTDRLGYEGFPPGTPVQTLKASLTRASDASLNSNGEVKVGIQPGTKWVYSGGGYTLLQLLIEEVSGKSFQEYMEETIFQPLGMKNSTFLWDDSKNTNLAKFYNENGMEMPHRRYTSLAATSLYTSLQDMELFVQAHFEGSNKKPKGRGVITDKTLNQIKEPHAHQMGAAIWGLGTMLFASNNENDYIIGHDGKNEPAINTAVRLNPSTGDGIIILEMGNPILATKIASDWVYWKTGNIDSLLFLKLFEPMLTKMFIGSMVICFFVFLIYWYKRKKLKKG